jgi:hypothetical protein
MYPFKAQEKNFSNFQRISDYSLMLFGVPDGYTQHGFLKTGFCERSIMDNARAGRLLSYGAPDVCTFIAVFKCMFIDDFTDFCLFLDSFMQNFYAVGAFFSMYYACCGGSVVGARAYLTYFFDFYRIKFSMNTLFVQKGIMIDGEYFFNNNLLFDAIHADFVSRGGRDYLNSEIYTVSMIFQNNENLLINEDRAFAALRVYTKFYVEPADDYYSDICSDSADDEPYGSYELDYDPEIDSDDDEYISYCGVEDVEIFNTYSDDPHVVAENFMFCEPESGHSDPLIPDAGENPIVGLFDQLFGVNVMLSGPDAALIVGNNCDDQNKLGVGSCYATQLQCYTEQGKELCDRLFKLIRKYNPRLSFRRTTELVAMVMDDDLIRYCFPAFFSDYFSWVPPESTLPRASVSLFVYRLYGVLVTNYSRDPRKVLDIAALAYLSRFRHILYEEDVFHTSPFSLRVGVRKRKDGLFYMRFLGGCPGPVRLSFSPKVAKVDFCAAIWKGRKRLLRIPQYYGRVMVLGALICPFPLVDYFLKLTFMVFDNQDYNRVVDDMHVFINACWSYGRPVSLVDNLFEKRWDELVFKYTGAHLSSINLTLQYRSMGLDLLSRSRHP